MIRKALLLLELIKSHSSNTPRSEEENERLEAFKYLIVSLEEIEKHTHVYKGEVARLTSNAVTFDLRLNKWRINSMYFS